MHNFTSTGVPHLIMPPSSLSRSLSGLIAVPLQAGWRARPAHNEGRRWRIHCRHGRTPKMTAVIFPVVARVWLPLAIPACSTFILVLFTCAPVLRTTPEHVLRQYLRERRRQLLDQHSTPAFATSPHFAPSPSPDYKAVTGMPTPRNRRASQTAGDSTYGHFPALPFQTTH